ncbi:MAG: anhydro-N-acetylmuramic acid kinase, partial [Planctomycetia bacterium]
VEFGEPFRQASLAFAREQKLTADDVLCTANHFVVRNLRDAVQRLPGSLVDEVWVAGGGVWNGFLWRLLQDAFAPYALARTDAVGLPGEARRAVHAALLAYFLTDNVPANLPALTGARRPMLLGSLVPGSVRQWDRWVCHLADRLDDDVDRMAA